MPTMNWMQNKKEYTWFPYSQILPVIGADLNIYPCQDKAYNLEEGLVGSKKEQRFKDFLFSDKNQFLRLILLYIVIITALLILRIKYSGVLRNG